MSEPMDIEGGYDTHDRDASPRRDRPDNRDRSPRRENNYRDRGDYGRRDREYRESREPRPYKGDRNYENSVFIGNIPYDCEGRHLRDLFSKVGKVISADVVTQNGRHRGMATVEFSNKEDVRKAIQEYDHTNFMDREIFVRQDNPPPAQKGDRGDRFSDRRGGDRYGGRDSRYGRDDRYGGDRRGDRYGRDDRYGARGGDRDYYGGRDDRYGGDRYGDRYGGRGGRDDRYGDRYPPRRDDWERPSGPIYEIFVGNLPFSVNWQALKDIFREAGDVTRADVRLDDSGRSRGFGVVQFSNADDVKNAIEKFQGFQIEGRAIDVREGKNNPRSTGLNERSDAGAASSSTGGAGNLSKNSTFTEGVEPNGEKNDTIYVGNLPFATSNDDLFELFETIGRVTAAEIKYDHTGRPSGNAVVKFESEESAEAAVSKLNNYNYGDRPLNITYAKRD